MYSRPSSRWIYPWKSLRLLFAKSILPFTILGTEICSTLILAHFSSSSSMIGHIHRCLQYEHAYAGRPWPLSQQIMQPNCWPKIPSSYRKELYAKKYGKALCFPIFLFFLFLCILGEWNMYIFICKDSWAFIATCTCVFMRHHMRQIVWRRDWNSEWTYTYICTEFSQILLDCIRKYVGLCKYRYTETCRIQIISQIPFCHSDY